jgi:hypothetical protein
MLSIKDPFFFIVYFFPSQKVGKWTADLTGVHPIYHSLMAKKNLPYLPDHPHVALPLECFAVGQVACARVVCVPIKVSLKQLAELLTQHKHNAFPVTVAGPSGDGQRGQFIGMVRAPQQPLIQTRLCKFPRLFD